MKGKVALTTGASSGIGRSAAIAFSRASAKVIAAADKNVKGGEETVELIIAGGSNASFIKCDVSVASDVKDMIDQCVRTYGRIRGRSGVPNG